MPQVGVYGLGSRVGQPYTSTRTGLRLRDVVRDVVTEAAPDELPLMEGLGRSDDESAVRRLTRRNRPAEPLAFGLDEIAVLVTPVVWIALDEAVRQVMGSTADGDAPTGPSRTGRRRGGDPQRPKKPTHDQGGQRHDLPHDTTYHSGHVIPG